MSSILRFENGVLHLCEWVENFLLLNHCIALTLTRSSNSLDNQAICLTVLDDYSKDINDFLVMLLNCGIMSTNATC